MVGASLYGCPAHHRHCRFISSMSIIAPLQLILEEGDGLFDALFKAEGRLPAEHTFGLAIVKIAEIDVAGTFGRTLYLRFVVDDLGQGIVNLIDGHGTASSDAEDVVIALFKCQHVGAC